VQNGLIDDHPTLLYYFHIDKFRIYLFWSIDARLVEVEVVTQRIVGVSECEIVVRLSGSAPPAVTQSLTTLYASPLNRKVSGTEIDWKGTSLVPHWPHHCLTQVLHGSQLESNPIGLCVAPHDFSQKRLVHSVTHIRLYEDRAPLYCASHLRYYVAAGGKQSHDRTSSASSL
jgi:hypothetical protein